jgi:hypothetical protein
MMPALDEWEAPMRVSVVVSIAAMFTIAAVSGALGWDGVDQQTGAAVEIDRGELVRSGNSIDVYDSEQGYKTYEVENIQRFGSSVEIEVTDPDTGDTKVLEMESD